MKELEFFVTCRCSHCLCVQETAWPALYWLVTFPVSLQPPLALGLSKPQVLFSPLKHYTACSEGLIQWWMESTDDFSNFMESSDDFSNFMNCWSGPIGLNSVCLQVNAATYVMLRAAAGSSALVSGSRRGIKHSGFFAGSSPHATCLLLCKVPLTFTTYSPCSGWDQHAGFALLCSAALCHLPLDMTYLCNKGRHHFCMCRSKFQFCSSTYF